MTRTRLIVLVLVGLTLLVRLVPAWILQVETADVASYRAMADAVVRGDNVYAYHVLYWYIPMAQFHPGLALLVANAVGWRFDFVFKLFLIVADAGATLLIFGHLLQRGAALRTATVWSLVWALNPVAILVSAFHGAQHSLVSFFVLGALVAAESPGIGTRRRHLLAISALALGLAIAFRTIPILLLPCFLVLSTRTFREAVVYTSLALLASVANLTPYLIYAPESLIREILIASGNTDYSGYTDFGWVSVLRTGALLFGHPRQFVPTDQALLDASKLLFGLAYGTCLLLLPYFRRESLGRALMLSSLLFYALFAGVASQYLIWVLPLAVVTRDRFTVPYSAISAAALASFYGLFYSPILFGRYPALIQSSDSLMALYGLSNVALVVISAVWVARILLTEANVYRQHGLARPVPWVESLQILWGNTWYRRGLLFAGGVSLAQLLRSFARAYEVFRPAFSG